MKTSVLEYIEYCSLLRSVLCSCLIFVSYVRAFVCVSVSC